MKVLVTGGAGFIGSHVVEGLIAGGHEVLVVDDLSSGFRENVHPEARFYAYDIRSKEAADLIRGERPLVLNHHAAQISVPDSVQDPIKDAEINIEGLLNLLEASVEARVGKVVFISSGGAIYGEAQEYPTSEACPPRPLSPYAVSKFASEHYLEVYRHQHGLDYTILRYANVYGPRQIPHGEAGVVAIFMNNLVQGLRSRVYHFPEELEGMERDYCYVGDVVEANLLALNKGGGACLNIGTGKGTRTLTLYREIYRTFRELGGMDLKGDLAEPARGRARPGDLRRSCLRVDRAAAVLGWRPRTPLREGLRKTLAWRLEQESALGDKGKRPAGG